MKIPETVYLAGLEIDVIVSPTLFKDKGLGGFSDYPNLRILLAGDVHSSVREIIFLHECLHFIFWVMGEDELRNNEKFVDLHAHFLHQVLKESV